MLSNKPKDLRIRPDSLRVGKDHVNLDEKYPFVSFLSKEQIEENKEKMNLAKEICFVSDNIEIYLKNLKSFFSSQKVPK